MQRIGEATPALPALSSLLASAGLKLEGQSWCPTDTKVPGYPSWTGRQHAAPSALDSSIAIESSA